MDQEKWKKPFVPSVFEPDVRAGVFKGLGTPLAEVVWQRAMDGTGLRDRIFAQHRELMRPSFSSSWHRTGILGLDVLSSCFRSSVLGRFAP
ncbi:hypothetical protein KVH02_34935 [Streptomyces olivaceus]|uniref:Uncharacterized protein n=1 Tax=Streptomyces olivaceus TaxID=47716 RepID=A0ABS7WEA7_STROV|nr:hypothetical protein [Streptomyces olivaceus]MBZ6093460.1 hypothetical protein [Streptomyces olivaceus]MBZ6100513.1 hypothetical protein [Streptomyces olivaceus]MBZ6121614.1 hypothetical protein [Streptomyces olivaceus]MBZ6156293.1 hypothetical protein [Streptomyces olivaceus]MBZ6302945.1 hypothetical protein [Streptomyces olivaceus]